MQPEDHAQAIDLMDQLQISVGGLVDRKLYSAICNSTEICCVVARQEQHLTGIALVELNRGWIRRRPLLALRMVIAKYRLRRASVSPATQPVNHVPPAIPFPSSHAAPVRWTDAAPRVLFIGVDPAWRGQGVGRLLYDAMFDQIRQRGNDWLVARIAADNLASIHLHKETGWVLYEDDGVVFAAKDLRQSV
jgi:ribosomal protein S18 acetylase RimI-like enzyme